jgi:hypothetical protein
MQELFAFLHVNPAFEPDMSQRYNEAGMPRFGKLNYWLTQIGVYGLVKRLFPADIKERLKSVIYTRSNIPSITPEEKAWLIDYYRSDVQQLSALLNKDLSHWLK